MWSLQSMYFPQLLPLFFLWITFNWYSFSCLCITHTHTYTHFWRQGLPLAYNLISRMGLLSGKLRVPSDLYLIINSGISRPHYLPSFSTWALQIKLGSPCFASQACHWLSCLPSSERLLCFHLIVLMALPKRSWMSYVICSVDLDVYLFSGILSSFLHEYIISFDVGEKGFSLSGIL